MIARVDLWGRTIGAVTQEHVGATPAFQYDPSFSTSGIQVAPIVMPLRKSPLSFPELTQTSFRGLPGLLSDSLPDKFGSTLIDTWLQSQGRKPANFSTIERLCYVGTRGTGALEFHPATGPETRSSAPLEIDALVALTSEILQQRTEFSEVLKTQASPETMTDILRVGTSAGGARAKALIAWKASTNEVRSGPITAGDGFEYWLLKFDGVHGNRDKELDAPLGFGAVEYAYSEMAKAAGVEMTECLLMEEGSRHHFMTKRFDRTIGGGKIHMLSLAAIAHLDFDQAGVHSYEQAFNVMRHLSLPTAQREQQFRRMVFNIVARNQDDHVKNIAYLMDKQGTWSLSPAYDVTYSFNPTGRWTSQHQMTVNGKRDAFELADLVQCARTALIKQGRARTILKEVSDVVESWKTFSQSAGVPSSMCEAIAKTHRLNII